MKALTVIPLKAGTAELSDVDEPPESDGPVLVETIASASAGPTSRSSRATTAGRPRAGSAWCSGTSRWAACSRRRPGRRSRRATWSSGSCAGPTRCPAPTAPSASGTSAATASTPNAASRSTTATCSERYRITADFLVKVDPALGELGVLLEPTSVVAKAWEQVDRIGNRAHWEPKTAVVTGAGPIGLLAALLGVQRGLEVHVIDQMETGLKPDLVRALGAPLPHRPDRATPARRPTRSSSAPGSARSSSTRWSTSVRAASSA